MFELMGAPEGNTNAEKWTEEMAHELLDKAIEISNEKEGEVYKYDFIGEIARELKTYHHNITNHLVERFPSLKEKVKLLKSNMESNCYYNTKKGNIKEGVGIVNLKSNHNWTDRQQFSIEADINIDPKQFIGGDKAKP